MRKRSLLSASAIGAFGLLGFAGPASASSWPVFRGLFHPRAAVAGTPRASSAPAAPSPYAAGYLSNTAYPSLNLTTTFVVPKVKCGHTNSVVAAGMTTISSGGGPVGEQGVLLLIGCKSSGSPFYIPAVSTGSTAQRGHAAHPGDTVVLHETASASSVSVSFADKTHPTANMKLTGTGAPFFSPAIEELKDSSGSTSYPIPNFGKITFTKSKLNHQPFGLSPVNRVDMVNSSAVVQIATSPFASDNESFKTTFKHS